MYFGAVEAHLSAPEGSQSKFGLMSVSITGTLPVTSIVYSALDYIKNIVQPLTFACFYNIMSFILTFQMTDFVGETLNLHQVCCTWTSGSHLLVQVANRYCS